MQDHHNNTTNMIRSTCSSIKRLNPLFGSRKQPNYGIISSFCSISNHFTNILQQPYHEVSLHQDKCFNRRESEFIAKTDSLCMHLSTKIQENQLSNYQHIDQQIQFLREQELSMKGQLLNCQSMNSKLMQKIDHLEKQNQTLQINFHQIHQGSEQITFQRNTQKNSKEESYFVNSRDQLSRNILKEIVTEQNQEIPFSDKKKRQLNINLDEFSRNSLEMKNSAFSCHSSLEKQKENHFSTPKSKMQLNLQNLIPKQINQRRRVFM